MSKSNEVLFCEKQVQKIKEFVAVIPEERKDAVKPSRKQFTRLLTEVASSRKVPGISKRMNENENYHCNTFEKNDTRKFLKQVFHIEKKEDLIEFSKYQFKGSVQYEQFMTFWKDAPLFNVNELNPDAKEFFEKCKSIAEVSYPLLQERGFYANDIGDFICVCRICNACEILTDEEFEEIADRYVRKALVFYRSFKEFALSYLCGVLYSIMYNSTDLEGVEKFMELQIAIMSNLFREGAPWEYYSWYRPEKPELVQLYPGDPACIVSRKAMEEGIGFMYRDKPNKDRNDSGWRFFHGDESDEYINNTENVRFESINTICNYRPDVLAYLEAPAGCAYGWNGKDWIKELRE